MIGLISAAQNYTPIKNASFSSYASLRIRGEIVDYLRKILACVDQLSK